MWMDHFHSKAYDRERLPNDVFFTFRFFEEAPYQTMFGWLTRKMELSYEITLHVTIAHKVESEITNLFRYYFPLGRRSWFNHSKSRTRTSTPWRIRRASWAACTVRIILVKFQEEEESTDHERKWIKLPACPRHALKFWRTCRAAAAVCDAVKISRSTTAQTQIRCPSISHLYSSQTHMGWMTRIEQAKLFLLRNKTKWHEFKAISRYCCRCWAWPINKSPWLTDRSMITFSAVIKAWIFLSVLRLDLRLLTGSIADGKRNSKQGEEKIIGSSSSAISSSVVEWFGPTGV